MVDLLMSSYVAILNFAANLYRVDIAITYANEFWNKRRLVEIGERELGGAIYLSADVSSVV